MPAPDALFTAVSGVILPRIPTASGFQPLPIVLAALTTRPSDDCSKGIGNHISSTIATQ
jgi:HPr kinase/phosphorylase